MKKILLSMVLCASYFGVDAQSLSNHSSMNDLLNRVESLGAQSGSVYDHFTHSEVEQLRNYYQSQNAWNVNIGQPMYGTDGINSTTMAYGAETAAYNKFVSFDISNLAVINQINNHSGSVNFEGAGAIAHDNPTVGYAMNIIGELYRIDVPTGTYTLVGNSGVANINGMEFNPVNGTLYALSSTGLYTVNTNTAALTFVGNLNNSGGLAVALAIDGSGMGYTYDLVDDSLYSVNLATGNATLIGNIGFDANFGQGMAWDAASNTIYMTAFNNTTFLAELRLVNTTSGNTTNLGSINGTTLTQIAWVSFLEEGGGTSGSCDLVGDTTGGPIWDRPLQDGSGMSSVGQGVTYHVYGPFTVDTAGTYTISSAQTGWDGMIFVYQNAFDPENALVNYLTGNDDSGGVGNSQVTPTLAVGTEYFLITTGFDPLDYGPFTNTITGPGTVTCDGGIDPPSDYCGPITFEFGVEPITHVIFANIDNESSAATSSPAHEDFTSIVGNVTKGETYELRVEGNTAGNWQNYITAFIDWNQNGILDDAGEVYEVGTITNSTGNDAIFAALNIEIPSSAVEGQTRMRIFKVYDLPLDFNLDPCAMDQNYGQVEDYTLNISSEGGGEDGCSVEYVGTIQDGIGNLQTLQIANDFPVAADTEMLVSKVTMKIFADINTADLYFYEDNAGMPGTLVDQSLNITPTSKTFISNVFGFNVYEVVFDLPTQISLQAGPTGDLFWVGISTTAGTEGTSNYLEMADSNTNALAMVSTDGGVTWVANSFGQDSAFKVEGECQTLGLPSLNTYDFAYYPNPTTGLVNINSAKTIENVQVYNLVGQEVLTASKVANGQINVQMLPAGTYVFRVALEGGQIETFKIIKK
ncbi:GEVED domain-containing protein [Moheibacter stercoris]|uniref:Por secretion system C-terminal sorting domain-containing protein n=1 Tax=Moheibacter stercoris TaxID=1628251 RepID=A0ABV2LQA6_9FLAO